MKKPISLTIISLILYFLQSFICGILIGTLNVNEIFAEIISIFLVLAIVLFMIRKKKRYHILEYLHGNVMISLKHISFFSSFPLLIYRIYFQVQK